MSEIADLSPSPDQWGAIPAPAGQPVRSFSARIPTRHEQVPHRIATWRGLPGHYERPTGMPWSETFVVYSGSGVIQVDGRTITLAPGAIVTLPKGAPYVMEITTTLEKMAVITEQS
jgi:mannose-6-phosphate isomerase-like protein (cupin superfamily)